MEQASDTLTASLLGKPRLWWRDAPLSFPTQKTLAIVCHLALRQQPTSRRELLELLWNPGRRRNLRQALHRLRELPGADHWLRVDNDVEVRAETDVHAFTQAVHAGRHYEALSIYDGSLLLEGLEPRAAPAFMEWLEVERKRIAALYQDALRCRTHELEHNGRHLEALELVRRQIELDGLDESAYRTAMRLEFRRGNLQAALTHYERCRRVLADELGLEPLEETQELAREVEQGVLALPAKSMRTRPRIPPKLLHPPLLAGRKAEWQEMAAAWRRGRTILIFGPAGLGKTRLMIDFVQANGTYMVTYGRPGDEAVPLSTYARHARLFFGACPEVISELRPWLRYEMARLVPDLFEDKPEPVRSEEQRARFIDALCELLSLASRTFDFLATDDMHFHDETSFAVAARATARLVERAREESLARQVLCARRSELSPAKEREIVGHIEAGLATAIELSPLDEEGVREMLMGLELDAAALTDRVARLTGGNPQLIVELLKNLIETGATEVSMPERIDASDGVARVVSKRLDNLDKATLRLLQAVACLCSTEAHTDVELLATVLEKDVFDVAERLAELEHRQLLHKGSFAHDLVYEAVLSTTPEPVKRLLHRRIAEALESQGAPPARLAHHWDQAGNAQRALPLRLEAAKVAIGQGAISQAVEWLRHVLEAAEPESVLEVESLVTLGTALLDHDLRAAKAKLTRALTVSERRGYPRLEAWSLIRLAQLETLAGDSEGAARNIRKGVEIARDLFDEREWARCMQAASEVRWHQGDFDGTEAAIRSAIDHDPAAREYRLSLAMLRWHQGRCRESAGELLRLLERDPEAGDATLLYHDLGVASWALAEFDKAERYLARSLDIWCGSDPYREAMTRMGLGMVYISRGRYANAEELLTCARGLFEQQGATVRAGDTCVRLAYLRHNLEYDEPARELCDISLARLRAVQNPYLLSYAQAVSAANRSRLGQHALAEQEAANALSLAERTHHALARVIGHRAVAETALLAGNLKVAGDHARWVRSLAQQCDMPEHLGYGYLLEAQSQPQSPAALVLATKAQSIGAMRGIPHLAWKAASYLNERNHSPVYAAKAEAAWRDLIGHAPNG